MSLGDIFKSKGACVFFCILMGKSTRHHIYFPQGGIQQEPQSQTQCVIKWYEDAAVDSFFFWSTQSRQSDAWEFIISKGKSFKPGSDVHLFSNSHHRHQTFVLICVSHGRRLTKPYHGRFIWASESQRQSSLTENVLSLLLEPTASH